MPTSSVFAEKAEAEEEPRYCQYPFNSPSFNPLTEWGTHYHKIFRREDLWSTESDFHVMDVVGSHVCEALACSTLQEARFRC